jgi:hypothetical protein
MTAHVPTQRDYEKLAEFRATLSGFLAFSDAAARAAGLVPRQHQALLAIKGFARRAPVTAGQLAERVCIQHHSAVGPKAAHRLEQLSVTHRSELKRTAPLLHELLAHFEQNPLPAVGR